jgi:hypothetical protein
MAGLTLIGKRLKVDFFTIVSDSQRFRFSTSAIVLEYYLFTSSELSGCSSGSRHNPWRMSRKLVTLLHCHTAELLVIPLWLLLASPPAKRALHAFFSVVAVLSMPCSQAQMPRSVSKDCPDYPYCPSSCG